MPRALTVYRYDSVGNKTGQRMFAHALGAAVDLASLSGRDAVGLAALAGASGEDRLTVWAYDGASELVSQRSWLSGSGAGTELFEAAGSAVVAVESYGYDNFGNRTYLRDGNGNVQTSQYDNHGRLVRTNNADHSATVAQYDAAGNRISVHTGTTANQTVVSTNIGASQGGALNFSWNVGGMAGGTTWVVWSETAQADIDGYAHSTGQQSAVGGAHTASIAAPVVGSTVYFRVVTRDVGGNLAWSTEQQCVVLPQNDGIDMLPLADGSLQVTAHFNGDVDGAQLNWGLYGLQNVLPLSALGGGLYRGILPASANSPALQYGASWNVARAATRARRRSWRPTTSTRAW